MGEREPLAVGEDARRHELVDPPGDLVDGHVGDGGHVVEPCFLGEDCDRFSNGDRRRAQPREAHQDCAGDRGRGDAAEALGGVCVCGESLCAELVDELSEQERIAAGRFPAALDELPRWRSAVRVREPARDPSGRQRPGTQGVCLGVGQDLLQQCCVGAGLGRTPGDHQQQWDAVEPARGIRQPSKRWRVGPVHVVDRQKQRMTRGELGGEPVQPVHRGVHRLRRRRHRLGFHQGADRQPSCPREQRCALVRVEAADAPLKQLPDNAERKLALEFGSRRA